MNNSTRKFLNRFLIPGKISFLLDGAFGSSGKGKLAYWIYKRAGIDNIFSCCVSTPNAGHSVVDGELKYFFQQLTAQAALEGQNRLIYLGPGSVIDFDTLDKECRLYNIKEGELYIADTAMMISDKDIKSESEDVSGMLSIGSTLHGCGAARIRKISRDKSVKLARDSQIPEDFITRSGVRGFILNNLINGWAGLCEISQGLALSLDEPTYPCNTSRNATISQSLDGLGLSPYIAGPVIVNHRTFPIRVHSHKYKSRKTGEILTIHQVREMDQDDVEVIEGYSGDFYEDSTETSWEELNIKDYDGSIIEEVTSVTQLPRRVATFSIQCLIQSLTYSLPPDPYRVYLSLNFVNYVDEKCYGISSEKEFLSLFKESGLLRNWFDLNIIKPLDKFNKDYPNKLGKYIILGTGPDDTHMVVTTLEKLKRRKNG